MNIIRLILLQLVMVQMCLSQEIPMRFQSITINDGLSLSSVYCISKDSKGFMWFGTEDGLNRYDGYQFKIYRTDVKNPNSICYKWIEHIAEDQEGCLWFGSRNGLSHFNPVNEVFTNYSLAQSTSIINDTITALHAFNTAMCVGTKGGLTIFNAHTLQAKSYTKTGEVYSLQSDGVKLFVSAENGLFCVDENLNWKTLLVEKVQFAVIAKSNVYVSSDNSIKVYDTERNQVFEIPIDKQIKQIESLAIDKQQRLFINTKNGLWVHHLNKQYTKQLIETFNTTNSLSINKSKALQIDKDGNVWYATHGDGLFIFDEDLQVLKCIHNPTDKESVSQNAFNCIYSDLESGNIWLGTYGAGINIYHPSANKFTLIKNNPLSDNSLPSNFIWSILEARDSCLWIGTNDKGLSRYCPKANRFTNFSSQPKNTNSLGHNCVRELFEDSDGNIWIGTDGGGLNRYNSSNGSFTKYLHDENDAHSITGNSVRVVFEDSQDQLWVGTSQGLNLFNRRQNTFMRYTHQPNNTNSLSNNFVYASIIEDEKGNLWIGTYGGGLNCFNPTTNTFKHYTTHGQPGSCLSDDIVFSLYEDEQGFIWVGTNEGLNILNPTTGKIQVLGMQDGLPNEVIYSIMPDDAGFLWMSTNHGVCCLDPQTMKTRNYDVSDGLQSNEFNGGAFHKGYSGRLYFGGVYGFNILMPTKIQENSFMGKPVITRLEVLGDEVQASTIDLGIGSRISEVDSQFVSSSNISYTNHIELNYSQRFFAIEYSGLNYLYPDKTNYAFQLSPMDKRWNKAGQRNYVSFANVKPGNYTFRVVSTNGDGVWSKNEAQLHITIRTPFWQTTWFVLLEITVVLLLIVFVYRFLLKVKMNKLLKNRNEQILETNRQLHVSEENLRQMNVTKDKFFSIISHDLKNPFSSLLAISNMLDQNYEQADEEDKRQGVQRINNSVKHIYLLLENLLTWSRSQRGKINFEPKKFDLSTLIIENCNLYREAAEKKSINLINNTPDGAIAYGDRNMVSTIIRNLTGNALKFTPAKGTVRYELLSVQGIWKLSVIDNGVGIAKADQDHLFNIDKKLKTDGTEGEKGTGLGLIICKEFADKNGGQIGVISESGKGAEFWFTIAQNN
ncbi:two-component regulator propeller domain-containing protein [Carboxylicivirga sp. M1479]|uniref:ligand-binding sensor domain-containing protein n=1 Tax=Carboxylicivirga sp. M1479 TaxID=2594476 RepID=UPI001177C8A9|nr:two-component regulator propeller domain-containing protein [Carboxylicivirga sp. M1479]TRX65932.1 hypothetical protein FNN09_16195 [Carboxylicivirga sp. M1479]